MRVRDFIVALCDDDISMDDDIKIYVSSKTDAIKEYLKDAKKDDCEWCLDEILQIDEIENRGGHIWLRAEEIW